MRIATFVFAALFIQTSHAADLTVDFKHQQNGILNVALVREGGSFSDPDKAFRAERQDTSKMGSQMLFRDVAPGKYAIQAFLDVNNNQKLDKNFVGIPKEPYGYSNDATGQFGPAKIEDALFEVSAAGKKIVIHLD